MHAYKGFFEAHITLAQMQASEMARFAQFCTENAIKPIQIELSRGDFALQQMTSSVHEGEFAQVLAEVQGIAESLRRQDFNVTRVKLEASPFNEGLPTDCAEVAQHPAENYFEHHLKLLLPTRLTPSPSPKARGEILEEAPLLGRGVGGEAKLTQICEAHQAHLSRNAFKHREDGQAERFVTLRHYGLGRQEATEALHALRADIEKNGFQVLKTITEYCVYDDHVGLDANWLTREDSYQTPCETCNNDCILNPV
jgi:hypothetical protein